MKMEVSVLGLLEQISALWMWAGGNLAASRFREVLFLDMRLPRGFIEEPQQPQGRRGSRCRDTRSRDRAQREYYEGVTLMG